MSKLNIISTFPSSKASFRAFTELYFFNWNSTPAKDSTKSVADLFKDMNQKEQFNKDIKNFNSRDKALPSLMFDKTKLEEEENKRRVKGNYVKTRICDIHEFSGNVEIEGQVFKSDEKNTKENW